MNRPIGILALLTLVSAPMACSSSGEGTQTVPDASVPDGTADGAHDANGDADATSDAGCCPRSPAPSGCMLLGGSGACIQACDFFCSDNWRVERDERGCELWRYDTRSPKPGENGSCFPVLDASIDAPEG